MTVQTYIHVSNNLQTLVYTSAPLFTIVVEYISVSWILSKWTLSERDVLTRKTVTCLHIHEQDVERVECGRKMPVVLRTVVSVKSMVERKTRKKKETHTQIGLMCTMDDVTFFLVFTWLM